MTRTLQDLMDTDLDIVTAGTTQIRETTTQPTAERPICYLKYKLHR